MRTTVMEANSPFSKGLETIIKEKGMKYVYVAEKAGYTKQELSDMLNGRRMIKACDIPRLAAVIGVAIDDIYAAGTKIGDE